MMDYNDTFQALLSELEPDGRYRTFAEFERIAGEFPAALRHRSDGTTQHVTVWGSNDYPVKGQHQDILYAMHRAIDLSGAGTGGARNLSGTNRQHVALEAELTDLHGKDSALIFTSGWISNTAALSTLGRILPDCPIFSDALNHNSMIEGIRRSDAERFIFGHNDVGHLEELIAGIDPDRPRIVAFESVYGMDGDVAPIAEICDVAHRLTIIEGTLAKTFGVMVYYVAGPALFIDLIRSMANSFIFTTSRCPHLTSGALAAARHVRTHPESQVRQAENAAELKAVLRGAGLPALDTPSHPLPVTVGDAHLCREICMKLIDEHGIYVQPINYPAVARGKERRRITPTPFHTQGQMRALTAALVDVGHAGVWPDVARQAA